MNGKKEIIIHEDMPMFVINKLYWQAGYTHEEMWEDIERQLGPELEKARREVAERRKQREQVNHGKDSEK